MQTMLTACQEMVVKYDPKVTHDMDIYEADEVEYDQSDQRVVETVM